MHITPTNIVPVPSRLLLETNCYAMTKDNKFIDVTKQEIYSYLSITLYMGIIRLPSYKLYWEKELNYTLVSGKMSQDCFTLIRRYFHFNDNSKCKPKTDPGHDSLFKVRPIVDLLRENLMRTEPEERQSIDEQIILFKERSVMRLHLPNKLHKWGFEHLHFEYLLELEVVGACMTSKFTKAEELWKLGPSVLVEMLLWALEIPGTQSRAQDIFRQLVFERRPCRSSEGDWIWLRWDYSSEPSFRMQTDGRKENETVSYGTRGLESWKIDRSLLSALVW